MLHVHTIFMEMSLIGINKSIHASLELIIHEYQVLGLISKTTFFSLSTYSCNALNPKSDQYQISPDIINAL